MRFHLFTVLWWSLRCGIMPSMVTHACNPSAPELEAWGSGIQGHHSQQQRTWGCLRLHETAENRGSRENRGGMRNRKSKHQWPQNPYWRRNGCPSFIGFFPGSEAKLDAGIYIQTNPRPRAWGIDVWLVKLKPDIVSHNCNLALVRLKQENCCTASSRPAWAN